MFVIYTKHLISIAFSIGYFLEFNANRQSSLKIVTLSMLLFNSIASSLYLLKLILAFRICVHLLPCTATKYLLGTIDCYWLSIVHGIHLQTEWRMSSVWTRQKGNGKNHPYETVKWLTLIRINYNRNKIERIFFVVGVFIDKINIIQ